MSTRTCNACLTPVEKDRLAYHRTFGDLCSHCYGLSYQLQTLKEEFASLDRSEASDPLRLTIQQQLKQLSLELQRRTAMHDKPTGRGRVRPHP